MGKIIAILAMLLFSIGLVHIGVKNNFQPYIQTRIMLFVAGLLHGYTAMLIIRPEPMEDVLIFGTLVGLFGGSFVVYKMPRQWRFIQEEIQRRKQKSEQ